MLLTAYSPTPAQGQPVAHQRCVAVQSSSLSSNAGRKVASVQASGREAGAEPPAHARAAVAASRKREAAHVEESAAILGDFLGLGRSGLTPAATVELDRQQVHVVMFRV
jgi:hypothetical protein